MFPPTLLLHNWFLHLAIPNGGGLAVRLRVLHLTRQQGGGEFAVRAKHDAAHLCVDPVAVKVLSVLLSDFPAELAQQIPEEERVRHHGDAQLGPAAEPLQECHRSLLHVLVGLLLLEHLVMVMLNQREVHTRELPPQLRDAAAAVAHVAAVLLPAALMRDEGGCARRVRGAQRQVRRLEGAHGGRDDHEVQVQGLVEAPNGSAPDACLEVGTLLFAAGCQLRVPVDVAAVLLQQDGVLRLHGGLTLSEVVEALRVPDEENTLASLLQKE
mmetsp:Transcript_8720/g.24227  ORF Transcript_8720/g.24227 Transcript_8720/m.24227 type:complete len:269 (-) Transcript_8720:288-1094(-)